MPLPMNTSDGMAYRLPSEALAGLTAIIAELDNATISVHAELFNLSHADLCAALGRAQLRGLTVSIIIDESQGGGVSGVRGLHAMMLAGVKPASIVIATSEVSHQFDHRKTCILDAKRIIDGSTNWTKPAMEERNSLLIFTDTDLAAGLIADHELHRAWAESVEASLQSRVLA